MRISAAEDLSWHAVLPVCFRCAITSETEVGIWLSPRCTVTSSTGRDMNISAVRCLESIVSCRWGCLDHAESRLGFFPCCNPVLLFVSCRGLQGQLHPLKM